MEMPLVSIIVPVYNAQSHLSRCLESGSAGRSTRTSGSSSSTTAPKIQSLPVTRSSHKDSRILLARPTPWSSRRGI